MRGRYLHAGRRDNARTTLAGSGSAEKIHFADFDAAMPQNVVRGRDVKIKIGVGKIE